MGHREFFPSAPKNQTKGGAYMAQEVEVKKLDRFRRVVQQMTALGNYKPEYDDLIYIYADLLDQYAFYQNEFAKSGFKLTEEYTNKAGATNNRKVPLVTVLENIRKDILSYSDRLRLNPKTDIVELPPEKNSNNAFEDFLRAAKRE